MENQSNLANAHQAARSLGEKLGMEPGDLAIRTLPDVVTAIHVGNQVIYHSENPGYFTTEVGQMDLGKAVEVMSAAASNAKILRERGMVIFKRQLEIFDPNNPESPGNWRNPLELTKGLSPLD